jgi:hypothetical protein
MASELASKLGPSSAIVLDWLVLRLRCSARPSVVRDVFAVARRIQLRAIRGEERIGVLADSAAAWTERACSWYSLCIVLIISQLSRFGAKKGAWAGMSLAQRVCLVPTRSSRHWRVRWDWPRVCDPARPRRLQHRARSQEPVQVARGGDGHRCVHISVNEIAFIDCRYSLAASKSANAQTKVVTVDFSNNSSDTYAPLSAATVGLDVGVLGTISSSAESGIIVTLLI